MFPTISRILKRLHTDQQGQILIAGMMFMAVIAGGAAIAVDTGSYLSHRRSLQNAADAIALASSQGLPATGDALGLANEWAELNGIEPAQMNVTITPQSLPSEPNPKVTVELTVGHSLTFMSVLGMDSAEISVTAAAVLTSPGGSNGLMPWSVLEEAKSLAAPGNSVVLKFDSEGGENGNFGALALDGNGGSTYRNTIKFGSTSTYCAVSAVGCNAPSVVSTEPGNMTGPTRQGTDYRIDNTSLACDTWTEVVIQNADGTHSIRPECNPFTAGGNEDSLRIIIIPVIDSLCNGRCDVNIIEFALFFLEGYGPNGCSGSDCEITGRFIQSNTNYGALMGVYDPDTFAHFVRLVN